MMVGRVEEVGNDGEVRDVYDGSRDPEQITNHVRQQQVESATFVEEPWRNPVSAQPGWPEPLDRRAFYGLAGEIVRAIEPHTEADPAALLVQLLVGFGNIVGRGPHTMVEANRHGTNLFAALVGLSAKGISGEHDA